MESQFGSTTGFLGKTMGRQDFIQREPDKVTVLYDAVFIICIFLSLIVLLNWVDKSVCEFGISCLEQLMA
jgi:hypothetical protein